MSKVKSVSDWQDVDALMCCFYIPGFTLLTVYLYFFYLAVFKRIMPFV